jgi:hypothetical protein
MKRTPVGVFTAYGTPASPRLLPGSNQMAHILSLLSDNYSANFYRAVRNIVLYPAFIESRDFVMTHIYSFSHGTLMLYMYPTRLHAAQEIRPLGRFAERVFKHEGLFHSIARNLSALSGEETISGLREFLLPKASISEGEVIELREASMLYESMLPLTVSL